MSERLERAHLAETVAAEPVVVAQDDRHIIEVTLIRAGRSKMGNVYQPEVLREALPLFEGARAFVDHQKPDDAPERSVRDLAGSYHQVQLDESGRVRGRLHLLPDHDWLFNLLSEAAGNPDLCGLSIDAYGDVQPGPGQDRTVTALHQIASVDVVTRPSAGGQVERVLQSDRGGAAQAFAADPGTGESPEVVEEGLGGVPPESMHEDVSSKGAHMADDMAEMVEAQRIEIGRLMLANTLAEAALPGPVTDKLRRRFAGPFPEAHAGPGAPLPFAEVERGVRGAQPPAQEFPSSFSEGTWPELEEAILEEKRALAQLTQLGQISGNGFEKHVQPGLSEYDKLQIAFDGMFDIRESEAAVSVPRLSGIREAFQVATGVDIAQSGGADRALRESVAGGLRDKVRNGTLSEAETHLREADVTNATFAYLLGTSMNKRLLRDYQAWPSEWQKFTSIVEIKDFKQQQRIRLGAFGSLSTVAEDAAYTTLTLSDTEATYAATKRGNLVQITRETIINDDLYAIKQIPQKLAVAAAFTLAEFTYNLVAPNYGNIYDAHPLFDSINHQNTSVGSANLNTAGSGAVLSATSLEAAVIAMRKQKNLAGKPIGLKPRYLLVPPDLEFSAMTILKSAGLPGGNFNDINPMMGYAEPIVSPQLNSLAAGPASSSIWIAVADPQVVDTLELGFVGGQANPILLIQDMPLYGLNFTQDVISYKVRHEYGGAVVDFRGFYLGNN